jgi:phospholipase C
MTVGDTTTNDDGYSTVVTADNIIRRLIAAGKTWKPYAEDLPSVGYTGGDVGNYARKHNVIALLSDVVNDPVQKNHLVPFTEFAVDLAAHTLPNYGFIVPNLCNDAHDCSLGTADGWLRTNLDPLVRSTEVQQDGLLIIVFDEAGSDDTRGGGRDGRVLHALRPPSTWQVRAWVVDGAAGRPHHMAIPPREVSCRLRFGGLDSTEL